MKFVCTKWNRMLRSTVKEATLLSIDNKYKTPVYFQIVQSNHLGEQLYSAVLGFEEEEFEENEQGELSENANESNIYSVAK